MVTVTIFFAVAAAVSAVVSAMGKCPLWGPVILTDVTLLLVVLPK